MSDTGTTENQLSVEDAMARLAIIPDYDPGGGPGPCVHTFRSSAVGLLGAHWQVERAREAIERYGVAKAGEMATGMKHGLVVIDDTGQIFLEVI